jgi:hypothetical protein
MTTEPQTPPVTDPDNVPEIFSDGQMNVALRGNFATITFTHVPADPTPMFKDGTISPVAVVTARIVLTLSNLVALRDLLNRVIATPQGPALPAGGPTVH